MVRTIEEKVNSWIWKWTLKRVIDDNCKRFITPVNSAPGKMYGLVKTHKGNNPVKVVTSGCNNAIENLPICIEHVLFELSESIPSRIKDSNHLLDLIDNINSMFLLTNTILGSFDIVNMFPNINKKSGLDTVKSVLLKRSTNTPLAECILESLELCLTCNNSIFNNRNFLQTDITVQGPLTPAHTVILQCLNLILIF